MLMKKQALTGAYGSIQCCLCSTYSTSTSPTVLPIPRARPVGCQNHKKQKANLMHRRPYATVKDSKNYDFRDNMNWPCHKSPQASTPSPYDILQLEKGSVYSKHKFYELVKIYHPDRHGCAAPDEPIHSLTRVERLERYRLVVQAHEILSDPEKRRAYDMSGMGWGNKSAGPTYTRGYAYGNPESPYANATWEDWERWYAKSSHPNSGGPQAYEGTYFNHNAFASFVILVAVISGVLQATHAGTHVSSVEEKAKAFTAQTHKFMNDRKLDNAQYLANDGGSHGVPEPAAPLLGPTADERVRHFLERRDPNRYGLKEGEEEHYRHHFSGKNATPPKPIRDERKTKGNE